MLDELEMVVAQHHQVTPVPSAVIGVRPRTVRVSTAKPVLEKRHCEKPEAHDGSRSIGEHGFHSLRALRPARSLQASHALSTTSSRVVPYTGTKS